jgi:hypothetical protein
MVCNMHGMFVQMFGLLADGSLCFLTFVFRTSRDRRDLPAAPAHWAQPEHF